MSLAEPFPLYFPGDARRPFSSDAATRRFAKVAQLEEGGRVLVLGGGPSSWEATQVLARDFGCSVLAVDVDEALLAPLQQKAQSLGLGGHVEVRRLEHGPLELPEGTFDAILSHGRLLPQLDTALRVLRPLLAHFGRVGLSWPVRVGRTAPPPVLEFWQRRLGAQLLLPRELLQLLVLAGYEPESVESLHAAELEALYHELEPLLPGAPSEQAEALREEMALHRQQRGAASYAFLIGRRREPGERPPSSRDVG
jgi:hypothetical protein